MKQAVTIRVDKDVLARLKDGGDGHQTRLNAILRASLIPSAQVNSILEHPAPAADATLADMTRKVR